MGRSNAKHLGAVPNAGGALTRLAYARLKANGIDAQSLLKKANLTLQQINNSNLQLRVRDQIRFLDLAAIALADGLFGFHLAQPTDLRELGFLYYVSASSAVMSEAFAKLARYSSIANEGLALKYSDGKYIGMTFRYVGVSRHSDRHQIEFFVAILLRLCRQLTGNRLVPVRVRFSHRRGEDYKELTEFFGTEVEFGAAGDDVLFAPAVKDMPIVSADHHLNRLLTAYSEEALARRTTKPGAFRSRVENAIAPLLPHGHATVSEIARRLGLSQRTLARRLSSERLTYSGILQDVKTNLAKRYLSEQGLSISQVAWLLGYKEVSSFTHAFKRWTGKTPRKMRAGHHNGR